MIANNDISDFRAFSRLTVKFDLRKNRKDQNDSKYTEDMGIQLGLMAGRLKNYWRQKLTVINGRPLLTFTFFKMPIDVCFIFYH